MRHKRILCFPLFVCLLYSSSGFAAGQTQLGIDVLQKQHFEPIAGAHVALITNHTGLDADNDRTVDILWRSKKIKLVCILTPEHGFGGSIPHGENIIDAVEPKTKLPIYSLYGKTSRPTDDMLKGVDTIVFDIQDVGTRFYTYITTMGQAMEVAAKKKLRFVVLDRPNPIRGDIVEGDILDSDIKLMTGYFSIPVRHGLTVGEIANWYNHDQELNLNLTVVKMKNWQRSLWFDQLHLVFTPPSPNIPSLLSALLYSGIGCFEATNISVGRGTKTPFEVFGAPWISEESLCAHLRQQNFPGVLFESIRFTPTDDIYKNESCGGVRILVTDRKKVRPYDIFLSAFMFLSETYPNQFKPEWDEIRIVTGSDKFQTAVKNRISREDYHSQIDPILSLFIDHIKKYRLY
jgi:uncharacterized protein YbbC (DUF1343 family)